MSGDYRIPGGRFGDIHVIRRERAPRVSINDHGEIVIEDRDTESVDEELEWLANEVVGLDRRSRAARAAYLRDPQDTRTTSGPRRERKTSDTLA